MRRSTRVGGASEPGTAGFCAGLTLVALAWPATIRASVLTVDHAGSGDHETIGAALAAALEGDVILIQPGTYPEDLDFDGKGVTLDAAAGPGTVEVQGTGNGPTVRFDSGEGPGSAILGLTLTGGDGRVTGTGGCVHIVDASPSLQDVTLSGCTAHRGGGIFVQGGAPSLANLSFLSNTAVTEADGDEGFGGGLYAVGANLAVVGLVAESNLAVRGGGVMVVDGTTTISTASFGHNQAERGGGLVVDGGTAQVDGVDFDQNEATHSGAGMSIQATSVVTVTGGRFSTNLAPDGGAIRMLSSTLVLEDLVFQGNLATGSGGALRVDDGVVVRIDGCTFDGNEADYGGAALLDMDAATVVGSRFLRNLAFNAGGALYVHGGAATLQNLAFVGNTAGSDGGALRFEGGSGHVAEALVFADNASSNGSAIHLFGGAGAAFRHITAVENASTSGATFRATADTTLELRNSIVAFPSAGTAISVADGATWSIGWTAAWDPGGKAWAGDLPELGGLSGNLSVDPGFRRFVADGTWNDDARLGTGSACVDAGDPPSDTDGSDADLGAFGGPLGGSFPGWDEDDDGVLWLAGDCDDTRSDVGPGQIELCDGLDRDCDGEAWQNCGDDDDSAPGDDDSAVAGDDDVSDDDSASTGDDDSGGLITPDTNGCACTEGLGPPRSSFVLAALLLLSLRRPPRRR